MYVDKCIFPTLLLFAQAPIAGCSHVLSKNGYSCNLTEKEGGEKETLQSESHM